jgi:uncharacterized protein YciI
MSSKSDELAKIMDGFLALELYVLIIEPLRGPEIAKGLYEHIQRQIGLEKDGIMFGAGPLLDEGDVEPNRGMVIIRASSFEEARKIADAEPYFRDGLRTYTLHRWKLNEGSMSFTVNYSDQSVSIG